MPQGGAEGRLPPYRRRTSETLTKRDTKMKSNKTFFIRLFGCLLLGTALMGCRSDDAAEEPFQQDKLVTNLYIPETTFYISSVEELTIQGRGFMPEDRFLLRSAGREDIALTMKSVETSHITFSVPRDLGTGEYTLVLARAGREQPLGLLKFRQSIDLNVPDKTGMTVRGAVFCGSTAIQGAVVSDGVEVTTTDENGYYWLPSDKYHGYVFVSVPSGYQPLAEGSFPQVWQPLAGSQFEHEQHDFELEKVDNDRYTIFVTTDIHLANRTNDLSQYNSDFVPDLIRSMKECGTRPCYTFVLGDMSWDQFWYANKFGMEKYVKAVNDAGFPSVFYHMPGNHDNDPYCPDDFKAETAYKQFLGPTYYSLNIGKAHFIALDNNVYINNGASEGTMGDRSFHNYVTDLQLAWLRKDLAAVDKSAPVFVGFHCPIFGFDSSLEVTNAMYGDTDQANLLACFEGFSDVHFLTGHTHYNHNTVYSESIMEHNTAAICSTWWWTGKYGNGHVCRDGSPGGYGVYEVDGTDVKWYYKGLGMSRDEQFLSYDMNKVKEYFRVNQMAVKFLKRFPNRDDYKAVGDHVVYINVWNWDSEWEIRVNDGTRDLPVTQIYQRDPLHTISYDVPRVSEADTYTSSFATSPCVHLFEVQAPDANTTLTITVTDRFGNTYKEVMSRPKAFSTNMYNKR